MTQDQKIIRAKVGLLELAKQLGNVSQAAARAKSPPSTRMITSKIDSGLSEQVHNNSLERRDLGLILLQVGGLDIVSSAPASYLPTQIRIS
jgi:hypothetical protein